MRKIKKIKLTSSKRFERIKDKESLAFLHTLFHTLLTGCEWERLQLEPQTRGSHPQNGECAGKASASTGKTQSSAHPSCADDSLKSLKITVRSRCVAGQRIWRKNQTRRNRTLLSFGSKIHFIRDILFQTEGWKTPLHKTCTEMSSKSFHGFLAHFFFVLNYILLTGSTIVN